MRSSIRGRAFEVGRGRVGSGGVVRDADERRETLIGVGEAALSLGASVLGYYSSGLPGPKGNRETFVWCGGDGEEVSDLEMAIAEAEPDDRAAKRKGRRR